MEILKSKIAELNSIASNIRHLRETVREFDHRAGKGFEGIFKGEVFIMGTSCRVDISLLLTDSEIIESIKKRIEFLEIKADEIRPILEIAERSFKERNNKWESP